MGSLLHSAHLKCAVNYLIFKSESCMNSALLLVSYYMCFVILAHCLDILLCVG